MQIQRAPSGTPHKKSAGYLRGYVLFITKTSHRIIVVMQGNCFDNVQLQTGKKSSCQRQV